MNKHDQDDQLQQLWQSIDKPVGLDVDAVIRKARRQRLSSLAWVWFDGLSCVFLLFVIYAMVKLEFSIGSLILFCLLTAMGIYWTYYTFKVRQEGLEHLADNTQDYLGYLHKRGKAQIKLGKFIIRYSIGMAPAILLFYLQEDLWGHEKFHLGLEGWIASILTVVITCALIAWWGVKTRQKGEKLLDNLKNNHHDQIN